jgi:L-seryl-tRNA(Ser) seleniumtransferase
MNSEQFRNLPAVNQVLDQPLLEPALRRHGREEMVLAIREELNVLRAMIERGQSIDGFADARAVASRVNARLAESSRPKLRRVINATGIVLHTNLGRAPMAVTAARAAHDAAAGYMNLELDLTTGKRASRQDSIRDLVCRLTGAESATAVNNNAAATVIALRALCRRKEVIISRGQLIEIGGSFRIPEIMEVSGATLREVGTTNITRLKDFEKALGPQTGAIMRVHTSNYRISGFTKSVSLQELVALGKTRGIPVIDDIGSGALIDFQALGFEGEPVARASIAAEADLVLFSGDKLMGGPQAGILAGRKDTIQKIEKDPIMRAFRLDKMTLAALEATLRLYFDEERGRREVPVLRMLACSLDELNKRAEQLANPLRQLPGLRSVNVALDHAYVGGGSLPDQSLQTWVLELAAENISENDFAERLRLGQPAVVSRVRDGKVVLDPRTVFPEQDDALVQAVAACLGT